MSVKKTILITAVAVLITALVVIMAVDQKISGLEQQIETLERDNAELKEQIAALEEQIENEQGLDGKTGAQISRAPLSGWESYFPNAETTTLLNEPVNKVRSLLGEPPVLVRSIAVNPEFNPGDLGLYAGRRRPYGAVHLF